MIIVPSRMLIASLLSSVLVAASSDQFPFIPLAELVRQSDLIVEADVTAVSVGVGGRPIATATLVQQWKGHSDSVIEFSASSALAAGQFAMPGERAVLFLSVDPTGVLVVSNRFRGRMPVREVRGVRLATCRGDIVFPPGTLRPIDDPVAGPFCAGVELNELKRSVDVAREQLRRSGGSK